MQSRMHVEHVYESVFIMSIHQSDPGDGKDMQHIHRHRMQHYTTFVCLQLPATLYTIPIVA